MLRASAFTAVSLFFLALPIHTRAATGPIRIPGPNEGYQITKNDSSRPATSGFEGRTDISTLTAVGNTPATAAGRPSSSNRATRSTASSRTRGQPNSKSSSRAPTPMWSA